MISHEITNVYKDTPVSFGHFHTGQEIIVSFEDIYALKRYNITPKTATLRFGYHQAMFKVYYLDNNVAIIQFIAEILPEAPLIAY